MGVLLWIAESANAVRAALLVLRDGGVVTGIATEVQ
jgi:hypothetical protein